MIIVNKDRTVIYNFDDIIEISLSRNDDPKIFYQRKGCDKLYILDVYDNITEAKAAMRALCNNIGTRNIFFMPDKKELQAYINSSHDSISRAGNGKKTVRRGGS